MLDFLIFRALDVRVVQVFPHQCLRPIGLLDLVLQLIQLVVVFGKADFTRLQIELFKHQFVIEACNQRLFLLFSVAVGVSLLAYDPFGVVLHH